MLGFEGPEGALNGTCRRHSGRCLGGVSALKSPNSEVSEHQPTMARPTSKQRFLTSSRPPGRARPARWRSAVFACAKSHSRQYPQRCPLRLGTRLWPGHVLHEPQVSASTAPSCGDQRTSRAWIDCKSPSQRTRTEASQIADVNNTFRLDRLCLCQVVLAMGLCRRVATLRR